MSELSRSIGVRGLTASLFNITVGGGIFAMPALVAQMLGASAAYAYLGCALVMLCIVLAFAVAGSRVPHAGGTATFAEAAFGPHVGFVGGALQWVSETAAAGAVMAALTAAVAAIVPMFGSPVARAAILATLLLVYAAVNIRGVRHATRVVEVLTIAKLAPLLVLVGVAAMVGGADAWSLGPFPEASSIGRATLVLIFAFSGSETAMSLVGEVSRPTRTIPVALVLALMLVTVLYISVQMAAVVGLGAALARTPDGTLAVAAGNLMGPQGRMLLLVGTVVSMAGYVSAAVMTTPRLVFAIARRGLLPEALGRVHPRYRTPAVAIVAQTLVFFAVAVSGSFAALAAFASVGIVSIYVLACASAIRLQWADVHRDVTAVVVEPVRVPTVVLAAGAVFCVALLSQATWAEMLMVGATAVTASLWFLTRRALGHLRVPTAS